MKTHAPLFFPSYAYITLVFYEVFQVIYFFSFIRNSTKNYLFTQTVEVYITLFTIFMIYLLTNNRFNILRTIKIYTYQFTF